MPKLSYQEIEFLGLEWVKLEIGIWLHFSLPPPVNVSIAKKVRKHLIRRELPYDQLLVAIESISPSDVSSESAATPFFHKLGTLVTQDFIKPSSTMGLIRDLLSGHLDKCRDKILRHAKSLERCSDDLNDDLSPSDSQNCARKQELQDYRGNLCIKAEATWPGDPKMNAEQSHDDHIYTTALKEMGDTESCSPHYYMTPLSLEPPRWSAVVEYKGFKSSAEGSTKKAAKHSASRALWLKMRGKSIM